MADPGTYQSGSTSPDDEQENEEGRGFGSFNIIVYAIGKAARTYLILSPRMNSSSIALATSSGYCLMGCFMV